MREVSRRRFLKTGLGAAAAVGFPTIVPARVFGQYRAQQAHQRRRDRRGPHLARCTTCRGILQYDHARIIAVCDLDAHRVEDGKKLVNDFYAKKTGKPYDGVTGYANYHELLANKDIDAVVVSTPDHWHALIGIDAVRAGKDVYLQKPASLDDCRRPRAEQRRAGVRADSADRQPAAVDRAVSLRGGAGAQWPHRRSCSASRWACPAILPGGDKTPMPVPDGFNYEMWLGETPYVYYTVDRVHPQTGLRPAGVAALPPVWRGHDHRMGRAPHRQRALGHEHGVHGAG